MIDRRQPVSREVRPVLAEDGGLAVDVVDELQPTSGDATVCGGARPRRRPSPAGWSDPEAIAVNGQWRRYPPHITADTVMPVAPLDLTRSSASSLGLLVTNRDRAVLFPAISSFQVRDEQFERVVEPRRHQAVWDKYLPSRGMQLRHTRIKLKQSTWRRHRGLVHLLLSIRVRHSPHQFRAERQLRN